MATVFLTEDQRSHVLRLRSVLEQFPFAFDLSSTGLGKSRTAHSVANFPEYKNVIVVCPASVEVKWRRQLGISQDVANKLGDTSELLPHARNVRVMTYGQLRVSGEMVTQETRRAVKVAGVETDVKYKATQTVLDKVVEGAIFIFDEIHCARNITLTMQTVRAIVGAVTGTSSKVLMMTATIYDRRENAMTFAYMLHISETTSSCKKIANSSSVMLTGAADVVRFISEKLEKRAASVPPRDYGQFGINNKDEADSFVFKAMAANIIPTISSSMLQTKVESKGGLTCQNVFVCVERTPIEWSPSELESGKTSYDAAKTAVRDIVTATYTDGGTTPNKAAAKVTPMSKIRTVLQSVEIAKAPSMARLAIDEIKRGRKVVVATNYIAAMRIVSERIKSEMGIDVEMISGATTKPERESIVSRFQKPDSELSAIVAMSSVVAVGIDLDDIHGSFPRTIIAAPSYFAINSHQLTRRIFRPHTTRGDAKVIFVYCEGLREDLILRISTAKAANLRDSSGAAASGIMYADEYDTFLEKKTGELIRVATTMTPFARDDVARKTQYISKRLEGLAEKAGGSSGCDIDDLFGFNVISL